MSIWSFPGALKLRQQLQRLDDPGDGLAAGALKEVLTAWATEFPSTYQERIPILSENRLEILRQAALILAKLPRLNVPHLNNRGTAPISAQQSRD